MPSTISLDSVLGYRAQFLMAVFDFDRCYHPEPRGHAFSARCRKSRGAPSKSRRGQARGEKFQGVCVFRSTWALVPTTWAPVPGHLGAPGSER